jgi:hypothetical protein
VRSYIRMALMFCCLGVFAVAFAQDTTQTGFAVVTLLSGNFAGLIASETLSNQAATGVEQSVVGPSALVTSASMLVSVDAPSGTNTAIAIANPSLGTGAVNLILTDPSGLVVLNTIVRLGPRAQLARYISQLFPAQTQGFSTPLLLTVSSDIPVSVIGFDFLNTDFTSIPLTSLSSTVAVPVQPLNPVSAITSSTAVGLGTVPTPLTFPNVATIPVTAVGLGVAPVSTSAIVSPVPTSTIFTNGTVVSPTLGTTLVPTTSGAIVNTSFGTALVPTTTLTTSTPTFGTTVVPNGTVVSPTVGTFASTFATPSIATFGTVTVPNTAVVVNTQSAASIGGNSLVFPQVAAGGGWSTQIAVGNTSSAAQVVRIDFFSSDGVNTGSIVDIQIAPKGVFAFSTNASSLTP